VYRFNVSRDVIVSLQTEIGDTRPRAHWATVRHAAHVREESRQYLPTVAQFDCAAVMAHPLLRAMPAERLGRKALAAKAYSHDKASGSDRASRGDARAPVEGARLTVNEGFLVQRESVER
jgi:hypothetical protein